MLGDAVAQVTHDMVTKSPESETQPKTTDSLDPERSIGLGRGNSSAPGLILGREGTNGVGDIVGSVRNGHEHGSAHLGSRPQMFDLVLIHHGATVNVV